MKYILTTLLIVVAAIFSLQANTYYIDQVNGNNTNSGLSSNSAWKTLSRIASAKPQPGDYILLKAGQVWREQLYINYSGTSALPITFGSYGTGEKPSINGSDLVTGFTLHSGNIWKKSITIASYEQVLFNEIRGKQKLSLAEVTASKDWFYDSANKVLYIYSTSNPSAYTSPGIEVSTRNYSIYINASYITVKDIEAEKTSASAVSASASSQGVIFDNLTLIQWTDEENCAYGGIVILGKDCSILNCTFGKNTGNELADENWAGYVPIVVSGSNTSVGYNKIYHNSTENENGNGTYAYGIRATLAKGSLSIYNNYIYHTGSNGIYISGYSVAGDVIEVHDNIVEYPGQAGISLFKTRSNDGIGGKGYVYNNNVSFANRLGGDVGGNGNQASGIHFNDGVRSGTQAGKPYMKWYCYENIVHDSQALKIPNGPDSDGIALDYNANDVEVFKNIVYNNYGKGIYSWNANNCKIYYNIVYGNDCGITLTALKGGVESTDNNYVYNNTFYKNYNGPAKGPNYNTEIYFGLYGNNNVIKNNIIYSSANGYGYLYGITGTTGCITDYNLLYSENGATGIIGYDGYKGRQTYAQWIKNHPDWDRSSVNGDPMFVNAAAGDFNLQAGSPAINRGTTISFATEMRSMLVELKDAPDIGACEYIYVDKTPPVVQSVEILNDVQVKISFSEKVVGSQLTNPANYSINNGIMVSAVVSAIGDSSVILSTSVHNSGTYTVHAANISDTAGNVLQSSGCSGIYSFTACPIDTVIKLAAETGALSGSAALKTQPGSLSSKALYFSSTDGAAQFNIKIPRTGKWYIWARFYYGNTSRNNSFYVTGPNLRRIFGDDSTKYNLWHYDGYNKSAVELGYLATGDYSFSIIPREPGQSVMIDQLLITPDSSFVPQNEPSIMPAILASPSNGAADQATQVTLKWMRDKLASGYGVQIAKDSAFSDLVLDESVSDTVKIAGGMDYSASYFWRVKSTANMMESDWSETRQFTCKKGTVVLLNANAGTLSGNAALGSMTGMKNTRCVYFNGTLGGVSLNVNIPETGKYYVWARMYYKSSGTLNSFYLTTGGTRYTIGGGTVYDQWHWDGYRGQKLDVGILQAGQNTIMVSGIERGLTLWIDQVVVTNDPNFIPTDDNVIAQPAVAAVTPSLSMNAMEGSLSGGAFLGSMTGSENSKTVYFSSKEGGAYFNVNVPKTGVYYVWARMYYKKSGGKNSFYLYVNGLNYILGDNDNQYDRWHWDGYKGVKLNVGTLNAGKNTIRVSGREPGTTLWVDKLIITSDPDFNPNNIALKENSDNQAAAVVIPTEYSVSQNYPNPFNPSTTVNFALPQNDHVSVKVYDILGNEVAELVNEVLPAGYHNVTFNAAALSSGVYICQVRTQNFVKTIKMQLLK